MTAQKNEKPADQHAGAKPPREGSKTAVLLDMLQREGGASLDQMVKRTGWLPHTVRAMLTGLRKRGFAIGRTKDDGTTRWHVADGDAA